LAPNPSFEDGLGRIEGWVYRVFVAGGATPGPDVLTAHSGSRSLRIDATMAWLGGVCRLTPAVEWETAQPISIDPSLAYTLSTWYRADQPTAAATPQPVLGVSYLDSGGKPSPEGVHGYSLGKVGEKTDELGWRSGVIQLFPPYPQGATQVILHLNYGARMTSVPQESCPVGTKLSIWYDDIDFRQAR
jgi:hypothetical protein